MCFSASASFISSSILVTIGTVSMVKSRTTPQKVLAGMPLLFAAQQFCEGFVWLSVNDPSFMWVRYQAMYAFLIMAQVGWPLFIPLCVFLIEKEPGRKKLLSYFLISGLVTGIYFAWCLIRFDAHIAVSPYHIQYDLDFPLSKRWFYGIIYFIPAMLPTFISSIRRMNVLGALLLCSYLISRFCYKDYIVSVWCFFGALSSITALFIILQLVKEDKIVKLNEPEIITK
jgi:hypothetical protein